MILAIETSTHICSVAFQNSDGSVYEKRTERKGSHSELLFIFIRELMDEHSFGMNELDAVLVSTGPGSYTGLRIAASAVKGMLFGTSVDVYAADTLAGFAEAAEAGIVHAVINARRKHLYHQKFEKNEGLVAQTEAQIMELTAINAQLLPKEQIIGTGIDRLDAEKLGELEVLDESHISAKNLLALFESSSKDSFFKKTTPEALESNYLTSSQVNNTSV